MKTLPISIARKEINTLVQKARETGATFVIGRHNKPEAVIMKFPDTFNPHLDEITNVNAYSSSFDFLKEEPDLYDRTDVKE